MPRHAYPFRLRHSSLWPSLYNDTVKQDMKDADLSPEYKRLLRLALRGAQFGLTGASSLGSTGLWFTPPRYAWLAYALVGATMFIVYWWVWARSSGMSGSPSNSACELGLSPAR